MFITIENKILNIEEIRNVELFKETYAKSAVNVYFKDGTWVGFGARTHEQSKEIFDQISHCCQTCSIRKSS